MSLFFEQGLVKIYNDDFLTIDLPENSVDLIVTSPPYNVGIEYASHDDTNSYAHYLDFTTAWLKKALYLCKDDGRMCLNIPLHTDKHEARSFYVDVFNRAKEIGWKYKSVIVWNKYGSNMKGNTAWGSWLSASAPFINVNQVETIVLMYKGMWQKKNKGESDLTRDDFMLWTNGIWEFSGEKTAVGHPAAFPLELPKRCIKLFSYVGDTVLDPFLGSGTTLTVCRQTGRHGIGIEKDEGYCRIAKRRNDNLELF